jgi:hypothetical protein
LDEGGYLKPIGIVETGEAHSTPRLPKRIESQNDLSPVGETANRARKGGAGHKQPWLFVFSSELTRLIDSVQSESV